MRHHTICSALAVAASIVHPVAAVTFDCGNIVVDNIHFDLSKLGGPKRVHDIQDDWPTLSNHTFALDICKNLPVKEKAKNKLNCSAGTRICYTKYDYNTEDGTQLVEKVFPIAGSFEVSHGKNLDPQITRLKDSASHSDAKKEGLRVELNGGYSSDSKKTSRDQKAIIEFECDADRTGLEENEVGTDRAEEKALSVRRRADDKDDSDDDDKKGKDDDGKKDDSENDDDDDDDEKKSRDDKASLSFVSYGSEGDKDKLDVLRLRWRTKYACEKRADDPKSGSGSDADSSAAWGFFTWLFIIVFLVTAAYLIFGSWLNYSRYGARGWDLLPHGDTLRDLPYTLKEYFQSVTSALSGSNSRGGYSAV